MSLFLRSLAAEWLKTRRSLASWVVLGGALFVPALILTARLFHHTGLDTRYQAPDFWVSHWTQTMESVAILVLPLFVVVTTALVLHLETANNAWKQLHASPQPLVTGFFAKLCVMLGLLLQFFVALNAAMIVGALVPAWVLPSVSLPAAPIPARLLAERSLLLFLDTLPVVAVQYGIGLRFRNVLAPIGAGIAIWIVSVGMLSWRRAYLLPYDHAALDFFRLAKPELNHAAAVNLPALALAVFAAALLADLVIYLRSRERG